MERRGRDWVVAVRGLVSMYHLVRVGGEERDGDGNEVMLIERN